MKKTPRLEDAIEYALECHYGQKDKAGEPYILHVLRVMQRMETEAERIVAVLHDVIEDTETSFDDLRNLNYPEGVVNAVAALTRQEDEPYFDYIERVKRNPIARRVKLADLDDNLNHHRPGEIKETLVMRYRKAYQMLS